jgi:PAS domain S-box-containing protein
MPIRLNPSFTRHQICDMLSSTALSVPAQATSAQALPDAPAIPGCDFLAGGGEMGARMRAFDWSRSPLGPAEAWPQSLRSAVSILLPSKAQIVLFWGEELITLYNDAYRPVFGAKHPGALGKPIREAWEELWPSGLKELFDGVLSTGEAFWAKDRPFFMERHGYLEETYFDVSYDPVRDESGNVGGVFCIVSETTGRVIGERRLRTLRDLGKVAPQSRSVADVYRSAAEVLRVSAKDIPFALLFRTADPSGAARLMASSGLDAAALPDLSWLAANEERVLEGKDLGRFGELRAGPWGEQIRQVVIEPFAEAERASQGFLVVGISTRRRLDQDYLDFLRLVASNMAAAVASAQRSEDERRRAEMLAELDRAKTAFFSNVSHEFRTPLTLMLSPVQDILAKPESGLLPESRELLSVVQRNGQRLLKLVNTLLDFARIEAGRAQASYEPVDLAGLTIDLTSNFRSACERAGLRLEVDCPPLGEPAWVDREMWEKIVLNLLSNAFKFTFRGAIAVSLHARNDCLQLAVRDTGTGIPEASLPRMFERFHRVEGAHGRSHEGSGIGLALVHELVKLHAGSISVESTLGKGSAFVVSIPRGNAHLPGDRIRAQREASSTIVRAGAYVDEALSWLPSHARQVEKAVTGPRVLLADDNADLREYVRRLLAEHYEVEAVGDGEAALSAARARRPDLIVTDLMMPRLDGFGLIRALRSDEGLRDVPVVALSARAGEEARIEGLDQGADDYLVKPFSARELLVRVESLLRAEELRRHARDKLRESREQLATLLEQLPVAVGIVDRSGAVVVGNAAMRELVPEKVPSLDPRHRARWRACRADGSPLEPSQWPTARALQGESVVPGIEFTYARDDGREIYMLASAVPLRDANGQISGAIAVVQNIDERKRAHERLEHFAERLRLVTDAVPALVSYVDAQGRYQLNNKGYEDWFGHGREEIRGKHVRDVVGEAAFDSIRPYFEAALAGRRVEYDAEVPYKDGGTRYIHAQYLPDLKPDGEVAGFFAFVTDLTERRRSGEALRRSEQELSDLFETASIGLHWVGQDGIIERANRAELQMLGYERGEYVGRHIAEFHVDGAVIDDILARLAHGERLHEYPAQMRCKDGSIRDVLINSSAFFEEGEFIHTRCFTQDVTARRRAEEAVRESDRRKDEFIAMLSHELRNPLAPLLNSLHFLRLTGSVSPAAAPVHEMMERQVNHLVRLTDDLLEMTRITRGTFELRRERVEVATVVRNAIETVEPLIKAAQHQLHVSLPQEPLWVDGDPVRLAQILSNLLNNAAKYTDAGGRMSLEVRRRERTVEVSVRDNGPGIAPELLPRMFEMFRRGTHASGRGQGGLGIGLALARRLAEMHGGTLDGHSEGPGRGTEFIVRLPLSASQAPHASYEELRQAAVVRRRILVVDDNRDAADSLGMLLEFLGAEVQIARTGAEALKAFEAYDPAVVLLDIGMPGMDGYEVARRIRAGFPGRRPAIVALTGWGQEEDRKRAREAGFDRHLVKPADVGALQAMLNSLEARS